jgi:hypothetical protein
MSLDYDRSGDGEPAASAPETAATPEQAPVTEAPVTTDEAPATEEEPPVTTQTAAPFPTFTPLPSPGSGSAAAGASAAPGRAAAAGTGSEVDLDSPLLSDTDGLRVSWQQVQASFVDDPLTAVTDAAGLVEQTAQALAAALRQRQQALRARWDRNGLPDGVEDADSGGSPATPSPDGDRLAAGEPDTEQLRLLIQRYRVLFNHLCQP